MTDSYVIVLIKDIKASEVIKKLSKYKIYYKDLNIKNNGIELEINIKDYKKVRNIFITKKVKKINYKGFIKIKYFFIDHYIFILSMIMSYIILIILSNTIFFINIKTNNYELKRLIEIELNKNGIKKYTRKKSYEELSKIKENIMANNKYKLEWIEIDDIGVTYIVELTERITNKENKNETINDIVANKDGLIKKIIVQKGTSIKYVNDYVKKGEVIISSNIIKNEEIVDYTNSSGQVYAEVWYIVNTTVPFDFIEYKTTGKKINHYYISFLGNKMTLLGKYDAALALTEEKILIDKPYLFFKLVKETKEIYEYQESKLNQIEAYNEALKRSDKSINVKLDSDEYIIDKKVLKKNVFSSKIEVEIFYRVYENIGISEKAQIVDKE